MGEKIGSGAQESRSEVAGHIAEAEAAKLKPTDGPWQAQHDWDMNGACTIIGNINGPAWAPALATLWSSLAPPSPKPQGTSP